MASTNKTTNYELSQYVGTDKPTYLGDYNSDMLKIDTAIHGVAENVGSETSRINIIENNVGSLSSLNTTDKTSIVNAINEVDDNSKTNKTNIGTLSNLTTTNKSTIVNAVNEVDANIKKFNLDNITQYSANAIRTSNATISNTTLTTAIDDSASIFKLYGYIWYSSSSVGNSTFTISTSLRPTSEYTIDCIGFGYSRDTALISNRCTATVKTNGEIVINNYSYSVGNLGLFIFPCLYFNNDFGDTPAQ